MLPPLPASQGSREGWGQLPEVEAVAGQLLAGLGSWSVSVAWSAGSPALPARLLSRCSGCLGRKGCWGSRCGRGAGPHATFSVCQVWLMKGCCPSVFPPQASQLATFLPLPCSKAQYFQILKLHGRLAAQCSCGVVPLALEVSSEGLTGGAHSILTAAQGVPGWFAEGSSVPAVKLWASRRPERGCLACRGPSLGEDPALGL